MTSTRDALSNENFFSKSVYPFSRKAADKKGHFTPFSQRTNSTMYGRIPMIFCMRASFLDIKKINKFEEKKIQKINLEKNFPSGSTRGTLSNKKNFPNPSIRSRAMPHANEETDNEILTPYSKQKRFASLNYPRS